ncbi:endonuclease/exonuclease/phosphatase family protein, partial [Trifolium medium]|nr:endonuclease/exonuclease/phosphatase family protein [Trifolium medium]
PIKDRTEVLKVLKKNERRGRTGTGAHGSRGGSQHGTATASSSSASVNNDWKHWVVMQGSDQVAVDDVTEVGQAIGVHFKGANENMFSVLAR